MGEINSAEIPKFQEEMQCNNKDCKSAMELCGQNCKFSMKPSEPTTGSSIPIIKDLSKLNWPFLIVNPTWRQLRQEMPKNWRKKDFWHWPMHQLNNISSLQKEFKK